MRLVVAMGTIFPVYYEDFGVSAWERYIADISWCPGSEVPDHPLSSHYYRMYARRNDDNLPGSTPSGSDAQNYARRGVIGYPGCCVECERCDCWCNSAWLYGEAGADPRQDATFAAIDSNTFEDVELTISGVSYYVADPPGLWPMELCDQWKVDHWGSINPNGTYILPWDSKNTDSKYCQWKLVDDSFVVDGHTFHYEFTVQVQYETSGGLQEGEWRIKAKLVLDSVGPADTCVLLETPPWDFFQTTIDGADRPYCSDETVTGNYDSNGTGTVTWKTTPLETPDYYLATFTGDLVVCDLCTKSDIVTQAITAIKDPAGFVLARFRTRCTWWSPYRPVPNRNAAHATGTITLGSLPIDGNTITLNDGTNPAQTFEFDNNESVADGNINVPIKAYKEDTLAILVDKINNASNLNLRAKHSDPPDNSCSLMNTLSGDSGNETITKVGAAISVLGMSGGLDRIDCSGWYWHATLTMVPSGADTKWKLSANIIDYRHLHNEGSQNPPGIPGLKFSCSYDWNTHRFYETEYIYSDPNDCADPPDKSDMANDYDCDIDGHIDKGGGGAYDVEAWEACGEGGEVELVAGWL